MLEISFDNRFKKEYKKMLKRGKTPDKLDAVLSLLANEEPIPEKYKDHPLTNSRNYINARELHIEPDWLLVYRIEKRVEILRCMHTGTHSDLFML